MKYRSKTEITIEILRAALGGESSTRVLYAVHISFTQSKRYFSDLTAMGLLEYSKKDNTYMTTQEGRKILESHGKLNQMLGLEAALNTKHAHVPVTD